MTFKRLFLRTLIQQSRLSGYSSTVSVREQNRYYDRRKHNKSAETGRNTGIGVLFASVLIGGTKDSQENNENKSNESKDGKVQAGVKRPDLPTFTAEQVSKHDDKSSFWVTYKHGVYDVTAFLPSHPGGEQIHNAAGLSVEPFWSVYGMHHTEEVYTLLESYRIGNLSDDDVVDHSDDDMWASEPSRDKRLIVKTAKPFNAEIPPEYQIEHFDTPNELFYVRQHMPVPRLEAGRHRLRVSVAGRAPCEFSLQQLQQFRAGSVRAALMCAGNRRSEMSQEVKDKEVKGISWAGGAISNAVWSGVYLRDLLLACGVDEADTEGKHVIFEGSDIDATGVHFSTSIPLSMALNPNGHVLLATHMNGQPLPPDHGCPLRAIVPGAPAVRSVKWLQAIKVSTEESPSHWHQKDYRSFNSSATWESAHFPSAPPVYSLPVTSACCDPQHGHTVRVVHGHIEARGYAYSGGGASVIRVDVSADAGRTWREAELRRDAAPPAQHYAWALWTARLPLPPGLTEVEIWVKATDSNFNTQPESFQHIWNIRGILSNAYHKITVKLEHEPPTST